MCVVFVRLKMRAIASHWIEREEKRQSTSDNIYIVGTTMLSLDFCLLITCQSGLVVVGWWR